MTKTTPVRPHQRADQSPRNEIIVGDAATVLSTIPTGSIDMILTSPPYFRLRNYEVTGQLGLESHVDEWVAQLVAVCEQAQAVLVPTGTLWLNLGDTYSTHASQGAPAKGLVMAPERLALALQRHGWILRNKILWAKTNPMPSNAKDRLSCTYELIYVLARQSSYFFDLDAVRVPHRSVPPKSFRQVQRDKEIWRGPNGDDASGLDLLKSQGRIGHPLGKNPGDVWQLATSSYRGAHHATFPVTLASRAILAGCPERRCRACRLPWRQRIVRSLGGTATRAALAPTCSCHAASEPGIVLDPFIGSGTTAVAADALNRDWLGVELNGTFAAAARQRITDSRNKRAMKVSVAA